MNVALTHFAEELGFCLAGNWNKGQRYEQVWVSETGCSERGCWESGLRVSCNWWEWLESVIQWCGRGEEMSANGAVVETSYGFWKFWRTHWPLGAPKNSGEERGEGSGRQHCAISCHVILWPISTAGIETDDVVRFLVTFKYSLANGEAEWIIFTEHSFFF